MKIEKAVFVSSVVENDKCPAASMPEYAFIGRSNVGKSSLINMITKKKGLAKTSSTPGKTQTLNHFCINDAWYLADVPGYGWAKVGQNMRLAFSKMVKNYLLDRSSLLCTFILADSRLPLQPIDQKFMQWMAENGLPFAIIFTKTDKQSQSKTNWLVKKYMLSLQTQWEILPTYFVSSAQTGVGRKEILDFVTQTNPLFKAPSPFKKKIIIE